MPVAFTSLTVTPVDPGFYMLDGIAYNMIPAGAAADTLIKVTPGRLVRVIITTLGLGPINLYDNSAGASGNLMFSLGASAPVGVYNIGCPMINGIWAKGNALHPAIVVVFS